MQTVRACNAKALLLNTYTLIILLQVHNMEFDQNIQCEIQLMKRVHDPAKTLGATRKSILERKTSLRRFS